MIIGHKNIIEELNNAIKRDEVSHSYIFSGPEGIGKKLVAFDFAKKILCENELDEMVFDNGNSPDFRYIEPSGKGSVKIEIIREITAGISLKPIHSKYKVYIINNAETITPQAQNALLKTFEEPSRNSIIILITSGYYSLLETIRSRAQNIVFHQLADEDILEYIKTNNIRFTLDMELVLELAQGSINKLNQISENEEIIKEIYEITQKIRTSNPIEMFEFSKVFSDNKKDIFEILTYFENILSKQKDVKSANCIMYIENAIGNINGNINLGIAMENMFQKIWEEYNV